MESFDFEKHTGFSRPIWLDFLSEEEGDIIPCDIIKANFNLINLSKSEITPIDTHVLKISDSDYKRIGNLGIIGVK